MQAANNIQIPEMNFPGFFLLCINNDLGVGGLAKRPAKNDQV